MEMKCLSLKDLVTVRKNTTDSEDTDINEQKENICVERRVMTPLKSENGHRRVSSLDITPIKHSEWSDPWTPTANLKILISAASPDIRDRELKKTLFRPIENEKSLEEDEEDIDDSCQFEALGDSERRPSRKQKSLGLLCQKFLALYPDYPKASENISISLDEVAMRLGVERRRIYDIMNVLESLMLVSRTAKNVYFWHGRSQLMQTLQELQRAGRQHGYHQQMEQRDGTSLNAAHHTQNTHAASSRRKDKSLRIMSQKFVMLFLVSRTHTVTLDTAARVLIEEAQDESNHSKYKTKVRRLYDIANILTSLNLIQKLHVREEKSRKPVFKWIGPADFLNSSESETSRVPGAQTSITAPGERREKMTHHSSLQELSTPPVNQRLISSAPSTPHRDPADKSMDFCRSVNRRAACQLKFGDSVQFCGSPGAASAGLESLTVPLQPHPAYTSLPVTAQFTPQPLAYLPQTPLLMLYRGHTPEGVTQGQRSPGAVKRREEDGDQKAKRSKRSESTESETDESHSSRGSPFCSREDSAGIGEDVGKRSLKDPLLSSQYLYVPNTAGLNGLNVLMQAGHTRGAVPAVAVPYFLLPSPLIAGSVSAAEGAAGAPLSFSTPAVLSPARFVMAGGAFGVTGGLETMSSPEHHGYRPAASSLSPQGPRTESARPAQTQTPSTPKEAALGSKSFFETPAALASLPAARKRGSAQRRLDIGHPAAN